MILEGLRISLIEKVDDVYATTSIRDSLVDGVRDQDWTHVSSIPKARSPYYATFLTTVTVKGHMEIILEPLSNWAGVANALGAKQITVGDNMAQNPLEIKPT